MDFTKLKNCMDMFVDKYNTPGVDCMVYRDHKPLFRYYAGHSDIENNKKMNGNELYFIYSLTKLITCTAALQLYEQGKYLLSDPISMYLPEFEKMKITSLKLDADETKKITSGNLTGGTEAAKEEGFAKNCITVSHLFTMGAGLDYNLQTDAIKRSIAEGRTSTRDIVGALSETVLSFEPGTRFRYSLCHDVLGALIEIWSGKKLGEYMKENIFDPIGMKNTFFGTPKSENRLDRMAALYACLPDGTIERKPQVNFCNITDEYESGGGGLTSDVEDYAMFLDTLACGGLAANGNRILSPYTVDLMRTNRLSGAPLADFSNARAGYGYGLGVRTHIDKVKSGSLSPLGEFGWDGAAGAFAMVDVDNKLSLTYFQHVIGWKLRIQSEMRNALYACLD